MKKKQNKKNNLCFAFITPTPSTPHQKRILYQLQKKKKLEHKN